MDFTQRLLTRPVLKDLSSVGKFYSNNIEMDDFISPASLMNTKDFALFPLMSNMLLTDDSYANHKQLAAVYSKNSSILLNLNTLSNYPQSYLSVLDNFRADFDEFS
jgi:hypothetical protein